MVKIVELDETETVGLASAGIGLAGSELPNKRKKKKARPPLDPLGGLAGMGNGTVTGGPSPGDERAASRRGEGSGASFREYRDDRSSERERGSRGWG